MSSGLTQTIKLPFNILGVPSVPPRIERNYNNYNNKKEKIDIKIYIVNYNEEHIIKHTIAHYRKYLPSAEIIICDNYSTDNSLKIARSLGCRYIQWDTDNKVDDFKLLNLKNNVWKTEGVEWILMIDMDEWLCITEDELIEENRKGTTILKTIGYNMVGESKLEDLSDIDLHKIYKGNNWPGESKQLCFNRKSINEINYNWGAHTSNPKGLVVFSEKAYLVKHMDILGIPYKLMKQRNRTERSRHQWKHGLGIHYSDSDEKLIQFYNESLKKHEDLRNKFPNNF